MKRIKTFGIALAALTVSLASCTSDFLTVYHPTQLSEADFYNSEERIMNALVAAYAPLQWESYSWGWAPSIMVADIMGDDMTSGAPGASDNPYVHEWDDYSIDAVSNTSRWWVIAYSGIYRANLVVENLPKIEGIDPGRAARIRAEAIFLRSYYYYLVWRHYGNIPYYEINLLYPYVADQISSDEVYRNVVWGENGLNSVINDLPETLPNVELGRITKAAAQMLKARFVLYQNDEANFADVLNDMKSIINSGHFALKTTVNLDYTQPQGTSPAMSYQPSPFEALYMDEGEFCPETIFDINHTDEGSTENWGEPYQAGGTVYPTFVGPRSLTNAGQDDFYHDGWNFGAIPEETYNLYDDADTRKDGGILNMDKWIAAYRANESKWVNGQPLDISYNRGGWKETGYYIKKYVGRRGYNLKGSGSGADNMAFRNNMRIFRYAETLLNAAELAVRAGDTATAQGYLDQIRDRAYGDTEHRIPATLNNVKMERRKEFVADGIRYWDLVRWGEAQSVLGPLGWESNVTTNGVARWLWPIPESEMNRAASTEKPLVQNPRY